MIKKKNVLYIWFINSKLKIGIYFGIINWKMVKFIEKEYKLDRE